MFTGLIEAIGVVADLKDTGAGLRLRVQTTLASELGAGESVAVNGVCLTVTLAEGGEMYADIGPETARITTLGSLRRDQPVNLERAMRADSRFGGHFVQGHTDATGTVEEIRTEADARWITIAFPPALAPYFVRKGSVAVDGVSLTVAGLGTDRFDVMIVPFTWAHTSLPALHVGSRVNLECDMVGKYVTRTVDLFMKGQGLQPKA
jgi:riboflavin synthase